MLFTALSVLLLASTALSEYLFVSSYSGTVETLNLVKAPNGSYSLTQVASSNACSTSPSWLEIGKQHQMLFCVNEGNLTSATGGSITSFSIAGNGALEPLNSASQTLVGPVASEIFYDKTQKQRAIAIASYAGGVLSTFNIGDKGQFDLSSSFTFSLAKPGPVAGRQSSSHPHEVVLDPSRKFLLVPDLGADLVRVFHIDENTLNITQGTALQAAPGSGPRHVSFWSPATSPGQPAPTYMYLVAELASTVTSYRIDYPDATTIHFTKVWSGSTYGKQTTTVPPGIAAAEIATIDDFVVISNRNDSTFPPSQSSKPPSVKSDSIASFKTDRNGTLEFVQLVSAGGSFPRNFHINANGTLVAVAEQYSSSVVILQRNVSTGLIGPTVASLPFPKNATSVVWA